MRKNKTKAKLGLGEVVYGAFVGIPAPIVVEIMGYYGMDFVIFDCEHMPMSFETVEDMIRACEVADITPIVRVSHNDRQEIVRYLDRGAQGIYVPFAAQPLTRADAEAAVRAVKYHPEGMRGMFYGRPSRFTGSLAERLTYHKEANKETMVICAVETMEAVGNLPETLGVDGIDVIYIGSADLSQDLGLPGQLRHPSVTKTVDEIISQVVASGKVAGYHALDMAASLEKGVRFVTAVDTYLLRSGIELFLGGGFDILK